MGKLIVIEGLDGSGKSTQIEKIKAYLSGKDVRFKQVKFPDYESPSGKLISAYLSGEFGKKPSDVNAFAVSSFYAVDRFASYKKCWKADYDSGTVIVADRYTTSNCFHQCSKLPREDWAEYLDWLYDFEFNLMGLPKPGAVIFLDMPPKISQKLMTERYDGDDSKKDIHESDKEYLALCREAALFSAERLGWNVVKCYDGDKPLQIDKIFEKIAEILEGVI